MQVLLQNRDGGRRGNKVKKWIILQTSPRVASLGFSSVYSLSCVWLFATHELQHARPPCPSPNPEVYPNSCPSSRWCHPAICPLLLPPIPPNIRVFSNESTLCMRWPKYWSFSFSIIPSKEHPGLISLGWTGWISLQSKGLSRVFSNTTVHHSSPSLTKEARIYNGEKTISLTSGAGKTGQPLVKEWN